MDKITIELTAAEFSLIHRALMSQPYGAVEKLVNKLRDEAAEATRKAQQQEGKPQ